MKLFDKLTVYVFVHRLLEMTWRSHAPLWWKVKSLGWRVRLSVKINECLWGNGARNKAMDDFAQALQNFSNAFVEAVAEGLDKEMMNDLRQGKEK